MSGKLSPHRAGLSLVEIVLSFSIFSLLSLALVGVIPATVSGTQAAGRRATAGSVAAKCLAMMSNQSLNTLVSGPLPDVSVKGMTYHIQMDVVDVVPDVPVQPSTNNNASPPTVPALDGAQARQITMTVTWQDRPDIISTFRLRQVVFRINT
jgi:Tfp pilus assembly protein PilV